MAYLFENISVPMRKTGKRKGCLKSCYHGEKSEILSIFINKNQQTALQ